MPPSSKLSRILSISKSFLPILYSSTLAYTSSPLNILISSYLKTNACIMASYYYTSLSH